MTRFLLQFVILASFPQCASLWGQGSPLVGNQYKNFAGVWTGRCCDFPGSKDAPLTVHLVVTIQKNGKAMHWLTTYGVKGQPGYDQMKRVVLLDPATGKVDYGGVLLRSSDLAKFADIGFGTFSGWSSDAHTGRISRGTFTLLPNRLAVLWESSVDGKNYTTDGFFTYKREGTEGSPNQQQ